MAKIVKRNMKPAVLDSRKIELSEKKVVVKPPTDKVYPFAMGDSVVVIDLTPVGRHKSSSPMGEGSWEGIDYSRNVVKVLIDGATKEFPYGTKVDYLR